MVTSTAGGPDLAQFKQNQRRVWAAGDYTSLAQHIDSVGRRIVERAGVARGTKVLDVACGSGNAALPAARAGARVTGLDLVHELLEAGRAAAERDGLAIEWVEGDAEDLPFADASFDCVLSTFGHMFAPRHERAAAEMARVCRPGGTIATCTWTPEGNTGEMLRIGGRHMPPPPGFASPPLLWGTEEHVRAMFPGASAFEFERDVVVIEAESVQAWAEEFLATFPPMAAARQLLGERFGALRDDMVALFERGNESPDAFRFPQEYLVSIVRL